jgi:hypothetical protein
MTSYSSMAMVVAWSVSSLCQNKRFFPNIADFPLPGSLGYDAHKLLTVLHTLSLYSYSSTCNLTLPSSPSPVVGDPNFVEQISVDYSIHCGSFKYLSCSPFSPFSSTSMRYGLHHRLANPCWLVGLHITLLQMYLLCGDISEQLSN